MRANVRIDCRGCLHGQNESTRLHHRRGHQGGTVAPRMRGQIMSRSRRETIVSWFEEGIMEGKGRVCKWMDLLHALMYRGINCCIFYANN